MKTNWPIKKLGEILSPTPPSVKLAKKEVLKSGKFPVIDQSQSFISGYSDNKSDLYQGDLPVIIFGDHTLALKFINFPFVRGADGTQILKPKEEVDIKFLFYQLLANPLANHGYSRHFKYLKEINIPVPPPKIQQKIVERLDAVRKAQELNDFQISKTDELFESLLEKEYFSKKWKVVKITDIARISSGGTPSRRRQEYYNGTIPWVKSGEVRQGLVMDTEEKITENGLKNSSAKIFPKNTILIAMYGATTGQVGILGIEAATNQAIAGIIVNQDKVLPYYLYYFYLGQTDRFIELSGGGAQPNISQTIIKNYRVPLPPLKDQQKIVEKLNAVQEYKKSLLKQKELLKELFDSVLHKSIKEKKMETVRQKK